MLFFLTCAAVPCFLVHELTAEEPRGELVVSNFTEATIVSKYLEPYSYDVDLLALIANGGKFTTVEITIDAVRMPPRGLEPRTHSSSRWQLGLTSDDPTPSCRALLECTLENADASEDAVSLGTENNGAHAGLPDPVTLTEPPRPRPIPTLTFPGMDSIVVTSVLKFPELPDSFTPADCAAWLATANRIVPGLEWRRIYLHKHSIRVDYFVEFASSEIALKVKGLINPKEGEIRESVFVGPMEYGEIQRKLRAVLEQATRATEEEKPPTPYAGGRYLRQEPPVTTRLPPTRVTPAIETTCSPPVAGPSGSGARPELSVGGAYAYVLVLCGENWQFAHILCGTPAVSPRYSHPQPRRLFQHPALDLPHHVDGFLVLSDPAQRVEVRTPRTLRAILPKLPAGMTNMVQEADRRVQRRVSVSEAL
ncbi:hypothetical protein B0H13DRAFT_2311678 [Mycena leptocephala]|nr:hypothetical protein B0H13DRAFT_2311678 [Mycena leptocephala]